MKALVYQGPGQKTLEERPKPDIAAPTDAIVKIVKTTICGTDLHILKGDVPSCAPGRILGHEGVGVGKGEPDATASQAEQHALEDLAVEILIRAANPSEPAQKGTMRYFERRSASQ
jgi:alcohol dehydrogenase